MAVYTFKLPDIGEGIAEAEIVAWHVTVGDVVEEDAPLADMMTDKATVEISSPVAGRVASVGGAVGDQIAIGAVLAILDVVDPVATFAPEQADGATSVSGHAGPMEDVPVKDVPPDVLSVVATPPPVPASDPPPVPGGGAPIHDPLANAHGRKISASPAVRQRAKALGIDLADLGTASDRVRHADLDAFLAYNGAYRPTGTRRPDETIRVIGLRRRIADNMAAAKRHIPHFTYVEEIDVTKLEDVRAELNDARGERPKLTILPLLIVAVCKTVAEFPMMNARYDDEAGIVTRSGAVHLGIATQTDAGLMVPVIRDAQDQNIWQLARQIRRLAEAARTGKAVAAELSGSTLTITSLGALGGIATTPVINRPEVAILGPNRIIERPVLRNGKLDSAKLMNLSISCDHRVVDGWDAASFVQRMKSRLESPSLLFVD